MVVGQLELIMSVELARLSRELNQSKRMVSDTVATLEKTLGALGVGFSAHLLIEKVDSVIEHMDQLQTKSERTGASVESLSKLDFFAGVSGSSSITEAHDGAEYIEVCGRLRVRWGIEADVVNRFSWLERAA